MEKLDKNVKTKKNNSNIQPPLMFNNLTKLDKTESLIILDFFHLSLDHEEEAQFIQKHLLAIKEVCYLDSNITYLIFTKAHVMEEDEEETTVKKSNTIKNFILEIFTQNKNIFYEQKLSNIDFITGFAVAKGITVYIFTDENCKNSKWLKIGDSAFEAKIKFSEFEYLRVTMDYMFRDKKRNYESKGKQPSKLTAFLDGKLESTKNVQPNIKEKIQNLSADITQIIKFQQVVENIIQYMTKSPPKSFKIIKNIIVNFSEQHANFFFKNYNIREDVLSFLLFSELINREVILNTVLKNLINEKVITCLDEIETMLCFFINPDYDEYLNFEIEDGSGETNPLTNPQINSQTNPQIIPKSIGKKSKRKKNDPLVMNFSLQENAEEEYKNLILNCSPLCNYIRGIIYKILCNCSLATIDRLPTNPGKYKNYILSFVNNQELLKISKKILNLNYDKIVNILTEGIIIEFIRNYLVVFVTDKKIHYNLPEIEKEKFRLAQIEQGK
jgi:hypothetical protein